MFDPHLNTMTLLNFAFSCWNYFNFIFLV